MESYKLVIMDRFRDDCRAFNCVYHNGKPIERVSLDYNEDAQWWEMTVYYDKEKVSDGIESEVIKDKIIQFILECTYETE